MGEAPKERSCSALGAILQRGLRYPGLRAHRYKVVQHRESDYGVDHIHGRIEALLHHESGNLALISADVHTPEPLLSPSRGATCRADRHSPWTVAATAEPRNHHPNRLPDCLINAWVPVDPPLKGLTKRLHQPVIVATVDQPPEPVPIKLYELPALTLTPSYHPQLYWSQSLKVIGQLCCGGSRRRSTQRCRHPIPIGAIAVGCIVGNRDVGAP